MRTEDLVGALAEGLRPVRRLPSPAAQAVRWLLLALAAAAVPALYIANRRGFEMRVHNAFEVLNWVASLATALCALLAAATLARPERSGRWAWLPVPPLALWLATLGTGCVQEALRLGDRAWLWKPDWFCLKVILAVGLPMAVALFWALRHAGSTRPVPVRVYGALAAAALTSALMSLVHGSQPAPTLLVWHGGAVALVLLLGWLVSRPLMLRPAVVG